MIDEYLSNSFYGKPLESLLDFMHSLDDRLHWKGGMLYQYQINEDYTYFIFVEEDKQNIIFVKCREHMKDKVEIHGDVEDFDLNKMPPDLRMMVCDYEVVSVSSIKLESHLNEEIIKKEIQLL
jgi:hypothetical protein